MLPAHFRNVHTPSVAYDWIVELRNSEWLQKMEKLIREMFRSAECSTLPSIWIVLGCLNLWRREIVWNMDWRNKPAGAES